MSSANYFICGVFLIIAAIFCGDSFAEDSFSDNSTVIAVIPVVKGDVDRNVYRHFDRLVPELKKISRDKIIKLECRYAGQAAREQDVFRAYQVATRIEKYLRVQHRLNLDLWITVRMTSKQTKPSSILTIAVLADDIKRLSSLPTEPGKAEEH